MTPCEPTVQPKKKMALKKSQLYSSLWQSCDELRGGMDSEHGDVAVLTANKSFILGYTDEDFSICRNLPAIVFDDFTTANRYVDFPFKVKSSAIKLLRRKHDRIDLRFVFERMQLIRFLLGDHKRYYISGYQNLELPVPDHDEQRAIVTMLSEIDDEIASLQQRREKAKLLKKGMMQ